jgi:hypothetical protein
VFECKGGQAREIALDPPMVKFRLAATSFAEELERDTRRQQTGDALLRKAQAGHVAGGLVFGYDNVPVFGPDGKRSHVERRGNDAEAVIVCRIFERYAAGAGLRTIAHELNAEGTAAPRPRRVDHPSGWAPSSVRELLRRELYHGVVLYNRTRKRDRWGRKRQTRREAAELVRVEAPALRVVSEDLWTRVQARLVGMRAQHSPATPGRLVGRPPSGEESRFLLTGFAVCGICGGSLCVRTRSHGRYRGGHAYGCTTFERKGPSVCQNGLLLPMEPTDRALLEALEEDLLDPAVITRTIEKAIAELARGNDGAASARVEALQRELGASERHLDNVTQAIVLGGQIERLVAPLQQLEARNAGLAAELASAERMSWLTVSHADLVGLLETAVKDYRPADATDSGGARDPARAARRSRGLPADGGSRTVRVHGARTLGRILRGRLDPSRGGPNGNRTRVSVTAVRGRARAVEGHGPAMVSFLGRPTTRSRGTDDG